MLAGERDLLSEMRDRRVWLKFKDHLHPSYFSSTEARQVCKVISRLHKSPERRDILPNTWIEKAMGKNPGLSEPMPLASAVEFVTRILLNARTLHWQERLQDLIEEGDEIDLSEMRRDFMDFERSLSHSSENGTGPLRGVDVLKQKGWERTPRCPTFLHRELDDYLGGGVGKGELCLLQAPVKNGKSSFLYTIGYRAALKGMNTFIFSCENYLDQMGARLLQIHAAHGRRRGFPKNLWMEYRYQPTLAVLENLANQLDQIDMLIVDYADNMRASQSQGLDFVWTIEELYDGIRHLAHEKGAVAWTATQEKDPQHPWQKTSSRRNTYGSDKKMQKCDLFLGIQADPRTNTATIKVLGRRGQGKVGEVFEVLFDQDTAEMRELE